MIKHLISLSSRLYQAWVNITALSVKKVVISLAYMVYVRHVGGYDMYEAYSGNGTNENTELLGDTLVMLMPDGTLPWSLTDWFSNSFYRPYQGYHRLTDRTRNYYIYTGNQVDGDHTFYF